MRNLILGIMGWIMNRIEVEALCFVKNGIKNFGLALNKEGDRWKW